MLCLHVPNLIFEPNEFTMKCYESRLNFMLHRSCKITVFKILDLSVPVKQNFTFSSANSVFGLSHCQRQASGNFRKSKLDQLITAPSFALPYRKPKNQTHAFHCIHYDCGHLCHRSNHYHYWKHVHCICLMDTANPPQANMSSSD